MYYVKLLAWKTVTYISFGKVMQHFKYMCFK